MQHIDKYRTLDHLLSALQFAFGLAFPVLLWQMPSFADVHSVMLTIGTYWFGVGINVASTIHSGTFDNGLEKPFLAIYHFVQCMGSFPSMLMWILRIVLLI